MTTINPQEVFVSDFVGRLRTLGFDDEADRVANVFDANAQLVASLLDAQDRLAVFAKERKEREFNEMMSRHSMSDAKMAATWKPIKGPRST